MSTLFHRILFPLYLQLNLIPILFAEKPQLDALIENSESANWPLQVDNPGLTIENVSLFSHFS